MPAVGWLDATWPFVRDQLPARSLRVVEIGCGSSGGFVPMLLHDGHRVVGVDPDAPDGEPYRQIEFEEYQPDAQVDAVVACTSLHHVADVGDVLDKVVQALLPGGRLVVVEWASERFDHPTAEWCFDRLPRTDAEGESGWLHELRDRWLEAGQPWEDVLAAWRSEEHLHDAGEILRELDTRFDVRIRTDGPYFFPDLADTSSEDEQAAIDDGAIRACGIRYVGTRR